MDKYHLEKLKKIQNFARKQYNEHHDIAIISILLDELVADIVLYSEGIVLNDEV